MHNLFADRRLCRNELFDKQGWHEPRRSKSSLHSCLSANMLHDLFSCRAGKMCAQWRGFKCGANMKCMRWRSLLPPLLIALQQQTFVWKLHRLDVAMKHLISDTMMMGRQPPVSCAQSH